MRYLILGSVTLAATALIRAGLKSVIDADFWIGIWLCVGLVALFYFIARLIDARDQRQQQASRQEAPSDPQTWLPPLD